MNSKTIFAALFVLIFQAVCHAQYPTHYSSMTKDNKVEIVNIASTKPNRRLILNKTVYGVHPLPFLPSAEGKLLYLEIPKEHWSMTNNAYSHAVADRLKLYDKKRSTLILHVCDATGKDLHVIPIPETFTYNSSYARFYGENYVGLQSTDRWYGSPSKITFVSQLNGSIFELLTPGNPRNNPMGAMGSPDAKKLVCYVHNGRTNTTHLYLNGKQVYPFYSEEILDSSLHPDEYNRIMNRNAKWHKENPGHYKLSEIRPDRLECWSPDNRYFALWRTKPPQPGEATQADNKERDLQFVVFDTDNITSGKLVTDYTSIVDAGVRHKDIDVNLYDIAKVVWDKDTNALYFSIANSQKGNRTTKPVPFKK